MGLGEAQDGAATPCGDPHAAIPCRDPMPQGNSAVAVAAKHRQWATLDVLLEHGARGDARALLHAVRRGGAAADPSQLKAQRQLCDSGGLTRVGPDGLSAVILAAATGDGVALKRLMELGGDVHAADAHGLTALHHCAERDDCACARELMAAGASLQAVDEHGNSPLHAAGRRGRAELFALLLGSGANSGALNARGKPPRLLDASAEGCCVM